MTEAEVEKMQKQYIDTAAQSLQELDILLTGMNLHQAMLQVSNAMHVICFHSVNDICLSTKRWRLKKGSYLVPTQMPILIGVSCTP